MTELSLAIKTAFVDTLHHVAWMQPSTRANAIAKAQTLTYKIGYPSWLFNESQMAVDWGEVRAAASINER